MSPNCRITIDTKDTDGHVVADGVQLIAK